MSQKISKKEYDEIVKKASPPSKVFVNTLKAFVTGGIVCVIGQLLLNYFSGVGLDKDSAQMSVSITLILASAILTGLGLYSKMGKFSGAGTIVPITGFANSVVSPAIEFKKEGLVFGMCSKMFIIAGPVIVYGIFSSVIVGAVYYFLV